MGRAKWMVGLVVFAASLSCPFAALEARAAVVSSPPVWPIPANAPAGPPPIPALPAAGNTAPPADQIADPLGPAAVCSGWQLQSNYGDRWPATSSWWEYQCSYTDSQYHTTCNGGACNQFCPYCWWETQSWIDYFVWDGSSAVFYGEAYSDSIVYESGDFPYSSADWWDGSMAQWYSLSAVPLSVSRDGIGSGVVSSTPAGISCGDDCFEIVDAGSSVALTATPDASSVFAGWSGDCWDAGVCQLTMDQARSVTAIFRPKQFTLSVATAGTGSGLVYMSPGATGCRSCQVSFDVGTPVTLTPSPDAPSLFTGWSGDCSGAGACTVTMDQARSVSATFALNKPPHASFTVTCSGLSCSFDGSRSGDSDGTIDSYRWDFGDGATGTGKLAQHTYGQPRSYTAGLVVTDNGGATATDAKTFNPISLSARGYRLGGQRNVELSWNALAGTSFDIYRNGGKIATVQASAYTDSLNSKGAASYVYKVCAASSATCSNEATVGF